MRKQWRLAVALAAALAFGGLGACKGSSGADWSGKELKPVEASAGGLAFSITLPEGLKKNEKLSNETLVAWEAGQGGSLTIAVAKLSLPPATLKDAVARSGSDMVIAKQEAIEGGFLVTSHSNGKEKVKVDVYKMAGGGALWCNATQAGDVDAAKVDAAKAWLEKVCLSMTRKDAGDAKDAQNAKDAKDAKDAPNIDLMTEMREFMGSFGTSAKITEALKRHGAPDLDTKDMGRHDLTSPRVLKAELHGAKLCYTLEAKAGETARTYLVCWDGGKIVAIDAIGMK
jgi:hypothetical protein